jgi:starch synthase
LGNGLEGLLKERRKDLRSVLHGVDYKLWDPDSDEFTPAHFSMDDLAGKATCRQNLAKLFGLEDSELPIVVMISRLLARKGLDLVALAMPELLKLPLKILFMGTGEDQYISFLKDAADRNPGRVGLKLAHDPPLNHQILAGGDIFLCPSHFEPCGLEQLYALKYGTVPLVRATGGLDDTVMDELTHPGKGTGYKFSDYTPEAMVSTLSKAIDDFRDRPRWTELMKRGMREDFSWVRAAQAYEEIFQQAMAIAAERQDG